MGKRRNVKPVPVSAILVYLDTMAAYNDMAGEHAAGMAKTVRALRRVEKAARVEALRSCHRGTYIHHDRDCGLCRALAALKKEKKR